MCSSDLVLELLTGSPAAGLLARDVDIALRVERLPTSGLVPEAVFSIPCGLYASPAYVRRFGSPATIDDLSGHRLIDFDHSIAHTAPKPWLRAGGRGATVTFRSNSPHARVAAARAGLGVVMLCGPMVGRGAGLRCIIASDQVRQCRTPARAPHHRGPRLPGRAVVRILRAERAAGAIAEELMAPFHAWACANRRSDACDSAPN